MKSLVDPKIEPTRENPNRFNTHTILNIQIDHKNDLLISSSFKHFMCWENAIENHWHEKIVILWFGAYNLLLQAVTLRVNTTIWNLKLFSVVHDIQISRRVCHRCTRAVPKMNRTARARSREISPLTGTSRKSILVSSRKLKLALSIDNYVYSKCHLWAFINRNNPK